ncbi:MAG: Crp/Fnr family transcriptional regulator [Hellea sp.]
MKTDEQKLALRVLQETDWLRGYSAGLAESLVAEGRLVHLSAGEWAQAEGDDRNGLFLIIDGLLKTYYAPIGDRVIMVGVSKPGSVLGHATRYSGGPRLVTAVCAQPSIMLEISERALDRVAAHSPDIWRAIASFTYENMRSALRLAAEVISLRPRERLAARLLALTPDQGDPNHDEKDYSNEKPTINIRQELLGEMIGVTRKTVNQHLSSFEKDGLIQVGYKKVELLDVKGLRRIASGSSV